MKTITLDVYTFDELDEEGQANAIEQLTGFELQPSPLSAYHKEVLENSYFTEDGNIRI